jgi:DNA processing protein
MICSEIIPLLKLYSIPGIGSGRMRQLIGKLGSAQTVLEAPVQKLIRVPGVDRTTALKIKKDIDEKFVDQQLKLLQQYKIKLMTYWDEEYPEALKRIYDPPAFIYYKGSLKIEDKLAMAIVGTRVPTQYGKIVTEQLCKELVENDITVVSGLARGIDTLAHRNVIMNKGRTLAVLGCGLDRVYPPENKKLAEEIAENGALLSEYPLGTMPDAGNFPRRNRIISGLSLGVLIIEAGMKSGALITAFQALEQNREVFAVPGPINSAKSIGTNQLIKEGAKLVQNVSDILKELAGQIESKTKKAEQRIANLNKIETEVYNLLSKEPVHVDRLVQCTQKSAPEILAILLTLELLGLIRQLSGKMFIRI